MKPVVLNVKVEGWVELIVNLPSHWTEDALLSTAEFDKLNMNRDRFLLALARECENTIAYRMIDGEDVEWIDGPEVVKFEWIGDANGPSLSAIDLSEEIVQQLTVGAL